MKRPLWKPTFRFLGWCLLLFQVCCMLQLFLSLSAILPLPREPWQLFWPLPNDIKQSFQAWIATTCKDQPQLELCTHNVAIIRYYHHPENAGQLVNLPQPGNPQGVTVHIRDQWCIVYVIEHQAPQFLRNPDRYPESVSAKQGIVISQLPDGSYQGLAVQHPGWSDRYGCWNDVERAPVDPPW